MTGEQLRHLYDHQLTPTERKYYEAWTYWHRFKIQPWRYLNSKTITRDACLFLMQIDTMYKQRKQVQEAKGRYEQQQAQFNAQMAQSLQQNSSQGSKRVKSVL